MTHFNFVISQNAKWGHAGTGKYSFTKKALKRTLRRGCLNGLHGSGPSVVVDLSFLSPNLVFYCVVMKRF